MFSLSTIGLFLKGLLTSKVFWITCGVTYFLIAGYGWHNRIVADEVKSALDARDLEDEQKLKQAQGEAKLRSDQNAVAMLEAEKKSLEQGKKDEKIITGLRNDVALGTRLLRQHKTCNNSSLPNTGSTVSESNDASRTAQSGVIEDSQRVIRAVEIGLEALNGWEEAQGIIQADRDALKQGAEK